MTEKTLSRPDALSGTRSRDDARSTWLERISRLLLGEPGTRDDLVYVLREAHQHELLDRDSLDMIEGVLAVSEMRVADIMVPRAQMDVVDRRIDLETHLPMFIETGHSRFPVVDADKDRIAGILLAKDLLRYFRLPSGEREDFDLDDILRPAVFVPEAKRLNVLLREFRANRNHMAIVVDEFGGVAGLVTIEDVIEQIVGDIADEFDVDEEVMVLVRGNGESVVKARMPLGEFNERFGMALKADDIDTVGGFLMRHLGHVPRRGERAEIGGLRMEILRADGRRVHLIRVERPEAP